jgi:hypothetical protein
MHEMASMVQAYQHDKQQCPSKTENRNCILSCLSGFNVISLPLVGDLAFLHGSLVPLSFDVKTLSGRSVVLDPGIPKRIA